PLPPSSRCRRTARTRGVRQGATRYLQIPFQPRHPLEVARNRLELVYDGPSGCTPTVDRHIEAVIDVVMNEVPLRLVDGLLNRMQLLCKLKAVTALAEHPDHPANMAFSALEALHDLRMTFVDMRMHS